jgi:hypothetical protein
MSKLLLGIHAFVAMSLSAPAAAQEAQDWPRLDLTLLAGATLSSANAERIDPIGLSIGATGIVRVNGLLGLGLVLEHHVFGWQAAGASEMAVEGAIRLGPRLRRDRLPRQAARGSVAQARPRRAHRLHLIVALK